MMKNMAIGNPSEGTIMMAKRKDQGLEDGRSLGEKLRGKSGKEN